MNPSISRTSAQVSAQVISVLYDDGINVEKTRQVLKSVEFLPLSREAVLTRLGLSNHYKNYTKLLFPLIEKGLLLFTSPGSLTSRNQQYKITLHGLILLRILELSEK
jgi:hypothetical protein